MDGLVARRLSEGWWEKNLEGECGQYLPEFRDKRFCFVFF